MTRYRPLPPRENILQGESELKGTIVKLRDMKPDAFGTIKGNETWIAIAAYCDDCPLMAEAKK